MSLILTFDFQHPEAKKIVRNYNKMAGVLLEYEVRNDFLLQKFIRKKMDDKKLTDYFFTFSRL